MYKNCKLETQIADALGSCLWEIFRDHYACSAFSLVLYFIVFTFVVLFLTVVFQQESIAALCETYFAP
jgi:hypothetical protein